MLHGRPHYNENIKDIVLFYIIINKRFFFCGVKILTNETLLKNIDEVNFLFLYQEDRIYSMIICYMAMPLNICTLISARMLTLLCFRDMRKTFLTVLHVTEIHINLP